MKHPILLALLLAVGAPSVHAAEDTELPALLEDYVVKRGDTCLSIAVERFGSSKGLAILHKYNELGAIPHHLKPGQILRLPAPPSQGADAELTLVRNQVETYTPDRRPGVLHDKLRRGHKVGTADSSAAELTFVDTNRLYLDENTLIVVLGQARATTLSRSETTLMNGSLRAHLAALAGEGPTPAALVRTEGSEVEVTPGESKISVDTEKTTRLAVYRGRSRLRAMKKTVEVAEGFGSKAKKGEPPTPPRPLPAATIWTQALPEKLLADPTAELSGSYGPGKGDLPAPARYRVQLARDKDFRDIITDTQVDATVVALTVKALPPGIYFARVSAIDEDAFEGPFGEIGQTRVELKPAPPPPPPPPPPVVEAPAPPPPAAPQRRLFAGVAVLAGGGLVTQTSTLGPKLAIDIEGSFRLGQAFSLAAGLRGGFELLKGAATDDPSIRVERRVWSVGLALSARYRIERMHGLTPFVGVLVEQLVVQLKYPDIDSSKDWFLAAGPIAGAALPLARGEVLLEAGWRAPTSWDQADHQNAPVSSVHFLAGYRLRF
jgi:hypothetical protein